MDSGTSSAVVALDQHLLAPSRSAGAPKAPATCRPVSLTLRRWRRRAVGLVVRPRVDRHEHAGPRSGRCRRSRTPGDAAAHRHRAARPSYATRYSLPPCRRAPGRTARPWRPRCVDHLAARRDHHARLSRSGCVTLVCSTLKRDALVRQHVQVVTVDREAGDLGIAPNSLRHFSFGSSAWRSARRKDRTRSRRRWPGSPPSTACPPAVATKGISVAAIFRCSSVPAVRARRVGAVARRGGAARPPGPCTCRSAARRRQLALAAVHEAAVVGQPVTSRSARGLSADQLLAARHVHHVDPRLLGSARDTPVGQEAGRVRRREELDRVRPAVAPRPPPPDRPAPDPRACMPSRTFSFACSSPVHSLLQQKSSPAPAQPDVQDPLLPADASSSPMRASSPARPGIRVQRRAREVGLRAPPTAAPRARTGLPCSGRRSVTERAPAAIRSPARRQRAAAWRSRPPRRALGERAGA